MKFSQPIDCKECQYFSQGDSEHPDYCDADGTEFVEGDAGSIPDWCPLEDAPLTVPKIDSDICPNYEQPLMCGQDGLPFCFGCGYASEEDKPKLKYCEVHNEPYLYGCHRCHNDGIGA